MAEYLVTETLGAKGVQLRGRIDAMTAPEIQQVFNDLILDGTRLLIADFQDVTYVSSAGLRIFLGANKQLKKLGGELILFRIPELVASVFEMSGFLELFRAPGSREELESLLGEGQAAPHELYKEIDSVSFRYVERRGSPGLLKRIGIMEPFARAGYSERDVVSVKPAKRLFGTGLAALGRHYAEYKDLFGESITVDGDFYFYPAVKRPAVDFMLRADQDPGLEYRFFHGFLFEGDYHAIVGFEPMEGALDLTRLVHGLLEISSASILGLVILAESKGLWGMHLKQVPIVENAPRDGKGILDGSNFPDWMDFPVEPGDVNNVVVGVGIAVRDRERLPQAVAELIPGGSGYHVHGCVFSREPFDRRLERFESELKRVAYDLQPFKVQHLLGKSAFSGGMVGIVELRTED